MIKCDVCGETKGVCFCRRGNQRMGFCDIHMPPKKDFDFVYRPLP